MYSAQRPSTYENWCQAPLYALMKYNGKRPSLVHTISVSRAEVMASAGDASARAALQDRVLQLEILRVPRGSRATRRPWFRHHGRREKPCVRRFVVPRPCFIHFPQQSIPASSFGAFFPPHRIAGLHLGQQPLPMDRRAVLARRLRPRAPASAALATRSCVTRWKRRPTCVGRVACGYSAGDLLCIQKTFNM